MNAEGGPKLPLLIYDGDCSFCRMWVDYVKCLTHDAISCAPSQQVGSAFPEIPLQDFKAAAQFVDESGHVFSGAHAIFRALSYAPRKRWMLGCYLHLPLFGAVSESSYRWIAGHRAPLYKLMRFLWGKRIEPARYDVTRRIFLGALGAIYLIAFLSWWRQIPGLIGSTGLLPAADYLKMVHEEYGVRGYLVAPTLAWLYPTDGFISGLAVAGIVASALAVLNLATGPVLLAAWALYLSQVSIGQAFMSFQWDSLLLETGFLAIFFAPWKIRVRAEAVPPSSALVWLLRWLMFRFIFSSGVVKLLGGDPSWRDLTALTYHYETQPLPTVIGWYMHQMPVWFHQASTLSMFLIELAAPFLIFATRRFRIVSAYLISSLQLVIFLTGNYTYFNLLTIALCIPLLDDRWFEALMRKHGGEPVRVSDRVRPRWQRAGMALLTVFIVWASIYRTSERYGYDLPGASETLLFPVAAMDIVGGYGLFQHMTKERMEIGIEGSNDGDQWLAYEFRYKPGDLANAPEWVQPHQPRLDWQMWFAALSNYRNNPWLVTLLRRLLEGSPEPLRLLASNPFPKGPPRYVRAVMYQYHFTTLTEQRRTGSWWNREPLGLYFPPASLRE